MTTKISNDTSFFGHPGGLQTLFFTEMWERMSYYGMRALLVIFMMISIEEQGLGFSKDNAYAIYGLYTGAVYFMGLSGGWIADRLLGGQRAVWYGGIIIMLGHIVLAIPSNNTFFIGLILVVLGTGLLKPNISAMVGQLYGEKDARRDSGYTIYYMGINLGSIIGNIGCGYLAANYDYHLAFGLAAIGMAIGLIQYKITQPKLHGISSAPTVEMSKAGVQRSWLAVIAFLIALVIVTALTSLGILVIDVVAVATYVAYIFTAIFCLYYASIYFMGNLTGDEKKRLIALLLICIVSACFWAGFEQAGSSLNVFAFENTQRMIGDFEIPTAWFQSLNSIFIITLSPFFAVLWIKLGQRMMDPSYGLKCALGILIMASGFIVMFFAAQLAASGLKVAPYWLVATYFLHTVGELCLSPVALSAVSKLSPKRFAGQMMGLFVLTYSIGNVIAGVLAGAFGGEESEVSELFLNIVVFAGGVGIVVLVLSRLTKKWEELADKEHKDEDLPVSR
ncbi:peptide MFS transporter [Alteromonas pelagimontana]|uniref:Peptide MFS transporter n=1 Tax=Alteromonas pelagimontana TaxID=1858656 RepID=A0A6M4MEZ2_9ALTE|nr:peptide MFS transporter [Alteromonas pelagimontana]QJR81744.1 peptide MFS transporter [Alteromonas pelagimontana]